MSNLRNLSRVCLAALAFGASLQLANCSSDNHLTPLPDESGTATTGGVTSGGGSGASGSGGITGGTGGTGGSGGITTGGTSSGGDASTYMIPAGETLTACPGATVIDPAALGFPACPDCSDAYCVPTTTLNAALGEGGVRVGLLADCADGMSKCVPASYVATLGQFLFKTCTAFGGAEGRCVNKCIPQVANQVGLTQEDCGAQELCAPCYMPTDGSPTDACGLGCDPGPSQAPYLFDTCCGDQGVCVPSTLVPADFQSSLSADTCTGQGELCTPSAYIDPTYKPPTCSSIGGAEGRCIPTCVGGVQGLLQYLPTTGCNTGEVCAPCYDPRTGLASGACSINGDGPTNTQPFVFPECCGGGGRCVPQSVVPSNLQGNLTSSDCPSEGGEPWLCVPKESALGEPYTRCHFIPNPYSPNPEGEGICMNKCVVPLFSINQQSNCPSADYGCIPCFDANGQPVIAGLCDPNLLPDGGMRTGGSTDASAD